MRLTVESGAGEEKGMLDLVEDFEDEIYYVKPLGFLRGTLQTVDESLLVEEEVVRLIYIQED